MIKNIFYNFIPNRALKSNNRDLPWMTDQFELTKKYCKYGKRTSNLEKIIAKINKCVKIISVAKDKYIKQICESLNNPLTVPQPCLINSFLSNKNFSAIPPLVVKWETISKFSQKASLFKRVFASQCTALQKIQAVLFVIE